jgi:hypothetical protein
MIHFIIILTPTLRSPSWFFPSSFPTKSWCSLPNSPTLRKYTVYLILLDLLILILQEDFKTLNTWAYMTFSVIRKHVNIYMELPVVEIWIENKQASIKKVLILFKPKI